MESVRGERMNNIIVDMIDFSLEIYNIIPDDISWSLILIYQIINPPQQLLLDGFDIVNEFEGTTRNFDEQSRRI